MLSIHLFLESIRFAAGALRNHLLRTFLSLLGVTIGIFCIIAVLTVVDALERSIRQSMSFLGENLIYVQKWPWSFESDYPWWKYAKRPFVDENDFHFLEANVPDRAGIAIFAFRGEKKLRYLNNSVENITLEGISHQFDRISTIPIAVGRYFTEQEVQEAQKVCILGHEIAENLFGSQNPLGKRIKYKGQDLFVVGVMEKQGANLLGAPSNDLLCLIPYQLFARIFRTNKKAGESMIALKGRQDDPGQLLLESEIRQMMRAKRNLKPNEEDNFALNRPEMVAGVITSVFKIVHLAGWVIGGFSMLVGGFGIANIMFVSVRERTNIIGIQKALGARKSFILTQFLAEAVFMSLLGGLMGILLVFSLTLYPQDMLEIQLSSENVITGLTVSSVLGILAGIIPAYTAAGLDPVEAIRSK